MRQTQRDTQLTALGCVCAFMCNWYACVCVSVCVRARDNSMTYVLVQRPKVCFVFVYSRNRQSFTTRNALNLSL